MKQETAPKIIGPDERDITRANSGQAGWEDRIILLVSSKRVMIGAPLIGGAGLALGAGDVIGEVTKLPPGVHRKIDAGKLLSSLDLDVQKAEAGDPPVDPSHTPSPDDQPHDPSSPTPHPTEPTPTPTRTPEPTPTRTPEPTPTRTPEPTPTATPLPPTPELRGALKVMKVHDKDAGGDVDFGEEGLPQGFNVDGPGANDFRMQTNAAKTPETGAVVAAVVPGQYTVCEDERPGWFETTAQRCKTVIVGAFQVAHVLFFNKQIEAPPPPPPQPPVEKKFVPTPEIPKVCVLPDGREVPLPAEFQAKLFGKDAQTIARMLEEVKCEFLGHDAKQTQQHEEIKQQIKEHDDKMDVQHTEQDKAHDAISDRLEDVWNKIKGLGRGFWDWADTVGIYAGPAALAALVIWRTRRRDQQPLAQPEGEQAQEPPAPEVIAEAVVAEPAGGVVVAEGQAPAQLELEPENVNVLASVLLELVNAITDEQLQTVAGRFTPEQLDHVRAVLYRMNVPNAMDLAPLAVMRVTRDTINRLPPEQRARIQRRVEEIVQERQVQQKQAVPPAAAEALQRPEQPQAAEAPVGAGQPPVTERPAETTPRVRRRISFNIGGIGRRYVQVGSTFTNARGVVYRVVEYTPDGRLFTLARTGQTEPVRYNKDRMERLMTEHFQRGQGPAQAGQAAAGV